MILSSGIRIFRVWEIIQNHTCSTLCHRKGTIRLDSFRKLYTVCNNISNIIPTSMYRSFIFRGHAPELCSFKYEISINFLEDRPQEPPINHIRITPGFLPCLFHQITKLKCRKGNIFIHRSVAIDSQRFDVYVSSNELLCLISRYTKHQHRCSGKLGFIRHLSVIYLLVPGSIPRFKLHLVENMPSNFHHAHTYKRCKSLHDDIFERCFSKQFWLSYYVFILVYNLKGFFICFWIVQNLISIDVFSKQLIHVRLLK